MPRSWKVYTANIEDVREPNIFSGPLGEDDEFVHYYRDHENGIDYFGVLTDDHTAWRAAQPDNLALAEYTGDVPLDNPHTQLALERVSRRIEEGVAEDESRALGEQELDAKGLTLPEPT